MQSLSGDYPEIWIVYDTIDTRTGETHRFYKQIPQTHSLIIAVRFFKQRPPRLNDGTLGKLIEIRYWKTPNDIDYIKPEPFIWRTY